MIVSDSEAETAAASVTINVGHLSDPAELPGLAHLHEHMLFLGTETYPEEGEYERFLNRHGGSSNAYTAMEETSYYFDVGSEHLDGALERFSHFFRAPLFTADALDRELHAVDSEHTMHQAEDNWRMFQLLKASFTFSANPKHPFVKFGSGCLTTLAPLPGSSANPKHPFAKFGSGCLTTLAPRPGVDTRALMIDFNRQHYVAPRMKLAVLGRDSLDELEALVRGTFGHVRGGDAAPPPKPDVEAFGPDRLGTRILAVPRREQRTAILSWPLPPRAEQGPTRPIVYISHVLGHEAEGSLHQALTTRGWARSISAGMQVDVSDFGLLRLSIGLTEEGLEHIDDVVEMVYASINLLRETPPLRYLKDELAEMGELRFRFSERMEPTGAVALISRSMWLHEPAAVLRAVYELPGWDPAAIQDLTSHLTPRNHQLLIIAREVSPPEGTPIAGQQAGVDVGAEEGGADPAVHGSLRGFSMPAGGEDQGGEEGGGMVMGQWRREKWYGTVHKAVREEEGVLERWAAARAGAGLGKGLRLPAPSTFVPTDFALRADAEPAPTPDEVHFALRADAEHAPTPDEGGDAGTGGGHKRKPGWHRATCATATLRADHVVLTPDEIEAQLPADIPASALAITPKDQWIRLLPPDLVSDEEGIRVWHKLDRTFRVPKAVFVARICTTTPYSSPAAATLCRLFTALLRQDLNVYAYDATLADLVWSLEMSTTGLQLTVRGFSHKLPLLLERLLGRLRCLIREYAGMHRLLERLLGRLRCLIREYADLDCDPALSAAVAGNSENADPADLRRRLLRSRFDVQRERSLRVYRNVRQDQPHSLCAYWARQDQLHSLCIYWARQVLESDTWHVDEYAAALESEDCTPSVMARAMEETLSRVGVDVLAHGNLCAAEAKQLGHRLHEALSPFAPLPVEQRPHRETMQLPAGGDGTVLLVPATEGELGYIVAANPRLGPPPSRVMGWSVTIQSPQHPPEYLDERIEAWLEDFDKVKNSIVSAGLEPDMRLGEESERLWGPIATEVLDFGRRWRRADAFKTLSRETVLAFFDRYFRHGAPDRRKLSVRVRSPKHGGSQSPEAQSSQDIYNLAQRVAFWRRRTSLALQRALTRVVIDNWNAVIAPAGDVSAYRRIALLQVPRPSPASAEPPAPP
ncbi:Metalloenzyme, LuxS/M16 peptidase-like protein [Tribonema minus]|uniref:Metalloenzyme, LuxS/M16 peptidase-like protein n=1 Tax=Tribonema minus TaxID=303371 RepID=A0A835YK48_9STRA|nr:Metalloenzyme, LuxS/M16 peptidase-like protein [Tribonema minus]